MLQVLLRVSIASTLTQTEAIFAQGTIFFIKGHFCRISSGVNIFSYLIVLLPCSSIIITLFSKNAQIYCLVIFENTNANEIYVDHANIAIVALRLTFCNRSQCTLLDHVFPFQRW